MQSANPKLIAKINSSGPDSIDLSDDAITVRAAEGRAVTYPWTLAHWWGRTENVIAIEFPQSETCVLPLSALSPADREAVDELVRARLGAPKYQL